MNPPEPATCEHGVPSPCGLCGSSGEAMTSRDRWLIAGGCVLAAVVVIAVYTVLILAARYSLPAAQFAARHGCGVICLIPGQNPAMP